MRPLVRNISCLFPQLPFGRLQRILRHGRIISRSILPAVRPLDAPCRKFRCHLPDSLPILPDAEIPPLFIRCRDYDIIPAAVAVIGFKYASVRETVGRPPEINPFILHDMLRADLLPLQIFIVLCIHNFCTFSFIIFYPHGRSVHCLKKLACDRAALCTAHRCIGRMLCSKCTAPHEQ